MNQENKTGSLEKNINYLPSGWLAVLIILGFLAWLGIDVYGGVEHFDTVETIGVVKGIVKLIVVICAMSSTTKLDPNEAVVFSFLGKYKGTFRKSGFYTYPFWWGVRYSWSLGILDIKVPGITVNDKEGSSIVIGADVFGRLQDTYAASYEVDDVTEYLNAKSLVALRKLAKLFPFDSHQEETTTSLKGSAEEVQTKFIELLTEEFAKAGYIVDSAAITHLAYSPEIASIMLQRQQAQALVQARETITRGAVGIVETTVKELEERGINFSGESKEKLVTGLLITLCSHSGTTNVNNVSA